MYLKRKRFSALSLLFLLVFTLGGCGTVSTAGRESGVQGQQEDPGKDTQEQEDPEKRAKEQIWEDLKKFAQTQIQRELEKSAQEQMQGDQQETENDGQEQMQGDQQETENVTQFFPDEGTGEPEHQDESTGEPEGHDESTGEPERQDDGQGDEGQGSEGQGNEDQGNEGIQAAAGSSASITAIGDSVMLGAAPSIQERLPDCIIDAKESRQVLQAGSIIDSLEGQGNLGQTVIIALGTNGPFKTSVGQELVDRLGSGRTIYWVTVYGVEWQEDSNGAIREVAGNNENVSIIDWAGAAVGHSEWFYNDGIHLNVNGQDAYAQLILDSIQ